jgi:hypothetical protein
MFVCFFNVVHARIFTHAHTSPTSCTARRDIAGQYLASKARFCPRTKISQNQALARQYILTNAHTHIHRKSKPHTTSNVLTLQLSLYKINMKNAGKQRTK